MRAHHPRTLPNRPSRFRPRMPLTAHLHMSKRLSGTTTSAETDMESKETKSGQQPLDVPRSRSRLGSDLRTARHASLACSYARAGLAGVLMRRRASAVQHTCHFRRCRVELVGEASAA